MRRSRRHRSGARRCAPAPDVGSAILRRRAPSLPTRRGLTPSMTRRSSGSPPQLGIASLRAPLLCAADAPAPLRARWRGRDRRRTTSTLAAASFALAPRATRLPAPDGRGRRAAARGRTRSDAIRTPEGPGEPTQLEDVMLDAAQAAIPAELLARLKAGRPRARAEPAGRARRATGRSSTRRGRPDRRAAGRAAGGPARARRDAARRRALAAAASPRSRASRPAADSSSARRSAHRPCITRSAARPRSSSSTPRAPSAMHRLAEVKGAIELLLADCYVRRDSVALVAFRGKSAEIVLPPTRSTARAKRSARGAAGRRRHAARAAGSTRRSLLAGQVAPQRPVPASSC